MNSYVGDTSILFWLVLIFNTESSLTFWKCLYTKKDVSVSFQAIIKQNTGGVIAKQLK